MGAIPAPADISDIELSEALGIEQEDPDPDSPDHLENLAETLPEDVVKGIGQDLLESIKADDTSRNEWKQRFARGLEILGIKDENWSKEEELFEGCSKVVHPMIAEAVVHYQARAMEELFPATGPVKAVVMGHETREKREVADRVQDHMNWQLTTEDPTYFKETGQLHMYLPIYGSAFRKGYHDPLTDRNVLRFVMGEDLIMPYSARSLEESPRVTHRFRLTDRELAKYIEVGYFRDVSAYPSEAEETPDKMALAEIEGREKASNEDDEDYEIYECDCYLDIEDDDTGGVAAPYTVSIDATDGKVYAIYRNWDEDDELKLRQRRYAEYHFVPGLGAYGFGYIHLIGGLSQAASGALRALLDAGAFSTVQGGFKAKDASVQSGDLHIEPGTWQDVEMTAEELKNAFYTPPFKEPSAALFNLLELLASDGRRFASITNVMVGESENYGPVGTTVALIEQASKVYSGINKRAHASAAEEFRILYSLNAEHIPEDGYPYAVPGADRTIYSDDYDETIVSVVPVSDPNIFSTTLRIAQAQAIIQMAQTFPHLYNQREANRRLLDAMRVSSIDDILLDPTNVPEMDAVTENVAMMSNRPVKAFEHQDHTAHLAVHMSFMQHPQFGGVPQAQEQMGPVMMAHMAEHLGLLYAARQREMGVPVPPISLTGQPGEAISPEGVEMYERQITAAAAQMIQGFMQQSGIVAPPQQNQIDPATQAKIQTEQIKAQTMQQKAQLDAQSKSQDMQMKQQLAAMQLRIKEQEQQLKAQASQLELMMRQQEHQQEMAMEREKHQQEMAMEREKAQTEAALDQAKGAQELQMKEVEGRMTRAQREREFAHEQDMSERGFESEQQRAEAKSKADIKAAKAKAAASPKKPAGKKDNG